MWSPTAMMGGGRVYSVLGTDSSVNTTPSTTMTWSALAISTPSADRVVFAAIALIDANDVTLDITAVTIGGVSATLMGEAAGAYNTFAGDRRCFAAIYYAEVPTGTTADVVATLGSEAADNNNCWTWACTGVDPALATTVVDAGVDTLEGTVTLDPSAATGDLVLAVACVIAKSSGGGCDINDADFDTILDDQLTMGEGQGACAYDEDAVASSTYRILTNSSVSSNVGSGFIVAAIPTV